MDYGSICWYFERKFHYLGWHDEKLLLSIISRDLIKRFNKRSVGGFCFSVVNVFERIEYINIDVSL